MSTEDDDQKPPSVGYGQPPKEHQFQKNKSGNPRGRPRKPVVYRQYGPRQHRRDVLSVTEAPTTIRTPKGPEKVPTNVAILLVARQKALAGHGPSIRLMLSEHFKALWAHYDLRSEPYFGDAEKHWELLVAKGDRVFDEQNIYKKLSQKRPPRRRKKVE